MTGHAQELALGGGPTPEPICPGIEALVHRRAAEIADERPGRRVAMASGMGGIAVAAVCAVLVLVLGSSSGGGLLTPRQAVAAAVQSLDGDGVLHWVHRGNLIESPEQLDRPEEVVADEWVDLATGDMHRRATVFPTDGAPIRARETWIASGTEWIAPPAGENHTLTQSGRTRRPAVPMVTVVDGVQALLERADKGELEIDEAGSTGDRPLAVITERWEGIERRIWITREAQPQVVRFETSVASRNAPRPIVTTTTTQTWQILPRTPESLAHVQVPSTAKPVP